jgi:hypothetical protein
MLTKLSIPSVAFLALSIAAFSTQGCSSSNNSGGTGGTTGSGGTTGGDASSDTGGVNLAVLCPTNPMRNAATAAMTATDFCHVYLQGCTGANNPSDGGFTSQASCEAAYTALNFDSTRMCRSYHVCNAVSYVTNGQAVHCPHAVGIGLCADTAPAGDASSGN